METTDRSPVTLRQSRFSGGLLGKIWKGRLAYLLLVPMLFFYGVFVLYPSLRTIQFVFMRYEFLRPDRVGFNGLENIIGWIQDPRVLETTWVTVKFFLLYVPASTLLAFFVALALDRVTRVRLATIYRTIFYMPVVLPAGIIFIVWTWIFDPTWGVLNTLIWNLGIPWPWTKWLAAPESALASLAFMSVWRLMGVTMLLFLVGLGSISNEIREAARIDGASEWQLIRYIELPLLIPTFLIILTLRLQVLGMVEEPLVMTQGSPVRSTMTYGLQAYYISFRDGNWDMGYGSTWFLILGLFCALTAAAAWKLMHREEN
ncbi:MAG: sugar ABC transporter permease [Chloroflexota bacterium]|nr:MAG: sugar ABC transporter permease [Chloroflexota bacterium]